MVRLMPLHVLTMLALLSLLTADAVSANIILRTSNYTFDPLEDMPADFGPRIPAQGVEGFLIVADPPTACTKLRVPVTPVVSWVALIQRSQEQNAQCTFDMKVHNAQQAGASAAIVYDDTFEPLIIMSKPLGHSDPGIPAVFVSQKTGIVMQKFLTTGTVTVQIIQVTDAVWVSMLMSALAGIVAVCLMIATFYCIRRTRGLGPAGQAGYQPLDGCADGMSAEQMRALPIVIAEKRSSRRAASGEDGSSAGSETGSDEGSPLGPKGGGTLKTCAICLEDYKDGEKQRVLPCNHRFHTECIDQWLSSRKPLCPVCKHDALRPLGSEEAEALAQEEADAAGDSPRPELSLPPFFFPIRRWRRRWQWGAGPSHPQATTNGADAATAPVDIEQPAVLSQGSSGLDEAGASSSGTHSALDSTQPAVGLGTTPVNFPGMHYTRSAASRLSAVASSDDITAADDHQSIRADRDALQQGAVRNVAALPAVRTQPRRPGRARSFRGQLGRSQAPDRPSATDDMVMA